MADIIGRRRWQGCLKASVFSFIRLPGARPNEIKQANPAQTGRMPPMLRATSEAQTDRVSTECGEDRPVGKLRRGDARPVRSHQMDRNPIDSIDKSQSLCWVDVFAEEYFSGRLTRLREGDHRDMKAPASIIVGPDATARCIDIKRNKVRHFQSRTVCPLISLRGNPLWVRIEVVSAIAS
jgi:hypothetical protein